MLMWKECILRHILLCILVRTAAFRYVGTMRLCLDSKEGVRRRQTSGNSDKERRATGPGPMRRLTNQPRGEEGVRRQQTSGNSNEERGGRWG